MSIARRCEWCGSIEDRPILIWTLNLAQGAGKPPKAFDLCSDECLRDFVADRMARRRAELVEKQQRRELPPSPLLMPSASPVAPTFSAAKESA